MSNYEILYIISSKIPEEEQPKITASFEDLVKKAEGKIISTENLGKKKLAYPIEKIKFGCYVLSQFELEPAKLKELDKKLKLMNEILRFLIVRKEQKKAGQKTEEISAAPVFKKEAPVFKKEELKKPIKKEGKKEKVSIEELDAKLDEILGEDIEK